MYCHVNAVRLSWFEGDNLEKSSRRQVRGSVKRCYYLAELGQHHLCVQVPDPARDRKFSQIGDTMRQANAGSCSWESWSWLLVKEGDVIGIR